MVRSSVFIPEHQFHVLIDHNGDEHSVAVLPNEAGKFLIIDQGKTLGLLQFNSKGDCVSIHGHIEADVLSQLTSQIKDHYSLPFAMA